MGQSNKLTCSRHGYCGATRARRCRRGNNQAQGNSLILAFGLGAWRAVVAAPPGFEVRDALTVCVILTRGFALVEGQAFAGGLREVYLSRVGVAFSIWTG